MPTRVYVASALPTSYPYKLQKPSTVSDDVRDTAESFIMDSGIGDDVTNREVLDYATEYDADYVVAKDYLHDRDRTTESVREFVDLYESHPCDSTPMIPLQPPYHEHVRDLSGFDHYVLGGMAVDDVTTTERIGWVTRFREVEPDAYAHGLGVGGGIEFTRRVARMGALDSLDCSTPEQAAMFGNVIDGELRQRQVTVGTGDGARKRNLPLAEFNSWQVADVWKREGSDTGQLAVRDF